MSNKTETKELRLCRHFAKKQNCFVVARNGTFLLYRIMGPNNNTFVCKKDTDAALLRYLKRMEKRLGIV